MKTILKWTAAFALLGLLAAFAEFHGRPGAPALPGVPSVVEAQSRKPVMMTHLFTGPDGQTHAEEIEAKFTQADVYKMMQLTGVAELHRAAPGAVIDFHPAPRRQYVITLSGVGEIELNDGRKIRLNPGHIDFVEDTTGKGHITRSIGTEDRITIQIPVADTK